MKKILFTLIFVTISVITSAQVKLRSDNYFQVGYNVYTDLTLGNYTYNGTNNGTWAFEWWNNGLNVWKPWPNPNSGNYFLFIRDDNGNVGIGKNPSYKLDVNGDIATYGTLRISSDARLKTNIKPLSNCMEKINKLHGRSYNKSYPVSNIKLDNIKDPIKYKTMLAESKRVIKNDNHVQLGLLANEVRTVLPELVSADSSGYLTLDYIGLIPVIIEALKEQEATIDVQNEQIKALQKIVTSGNNLKSASVTTNTEILDITTVPSLDQNAPNPFSQTTKINYYLPDAVQNATLYIYDMNEAQLKNIPIYQKGKGSVTIVGSEFQPGMYLYTLIADGKEIDTKHMILTE